MSHKNKIMNFQALTRGDFRLGTIGKVETAKVGILFINALGCLGLRPRFFGKSGIEDLFII